MLWSRNILRAVPCAVVLAMVLSNVAEAAPGVTKGQVQFVRSHDAAQQPAWAPPIFWFTLKGVSQAGACATVEFSTASVLFVASDKDAYALVIAAEVSGQEIEVNFDDAKLINGFCSISYVTIGNPAPLQ